jgi:hypothetical protein
MMCAAIASSTAMLIATMIKKNFPKIHQFLGFADFPPLKAYTPGTG